jgi:ParB family chromosome partitioning protein
VAKKALGRGIDALIKSATGDLVLRKIPLTDISSNKDQPRRHFDDDALAELAESITEQGVLQPILVEEQNLENGKRYQIIAGERRYRATRRAGLTEIPALVRSVQQASRIEIALIENIQRENLNPIEEAEAYQRMIKDLGFSQEEVAGKVGKRRSTIANSLRLLNLPKRAQMALEEKKLTSGHARAILMLKNPDAANTLFRKIVDEGVSVREAEKWAKQKETLKEKKIPAAGVPKKMSSELKAIQQQLIEYFGTKITISGSEERGKIQISYFSLDDLNRLLDLFIKP